MQASNDLKRLYTLSITLSKFREDNCDHKQLATRLNIQSNQDELGLEKTIKLE